MNYDYAQRRRIALAIAVTVILAPAAFLLNRSATDDQPSAAAAPVISNPPTDTGVSAGALTSGQPSPGVAETDPLGTAPVGYLTGSTLPDDRSPARIAIPKLPESIKGTASFSNSISSTLNCQAKNIPFNATVTVTNLDNSQSVQCVASIGGVPPESDIVLATDTFARIADLTDAPVPVQLTWIAAATTVTP